MRAQITHLVGDSWVPRPGVKVEFSTTDGGVLDKTRDWTNSNGIVEVRVTVPNNANNVKVKASTKGMWPQKFLDLGDNRQDLIGIDTSYQLTVSTNIWILATIHVIPEVPIGTLAVIVTCFAALLVKSRKASRQWHN